MTASSLLLRTRTTVALDIGAARVSWSLLAPLGTHERETLFLPEGCVEGNGAGDHEGAQGFLEWPTELQYVVVGLGEHCRAPARMDQGCASCMGPLGRGR